MRGLFAAAQRFYLLFQLHTTPDRMAADGYWAGSSCLACLGPHMAVVLPDGRTYRTLSQINPPEFYTEVRAADTGVTRPTMALKLAGLVVYSACT